MEATAKTSCQTCMLDAFFPNGKRDACVQSCEGGAFLNFDRGLNSYYCQLCAPGQGVCLYIISHFYGKSNLFADDRHGEL